MDIRTTFHNFVATEAVHDHLHHSLASAGFCDQLCRAEAVLVQDADATEIMCHLSLVMESSNIISSSAAARDVYRAINIAVKRAIRLESAQGAQQDVPRYIASAEASSVAASPANPA